MWERQASNVKGKGVRAKFRILQEDLELKFIAAMRNKAGDIFVRFADLDTRA